VSLSRPAGLKRPAAAAALTLATVTLAAFTLSAGSVAQAASSGKTSTYIVQLKGDPVATYTGGDSGFIATKPAHGSKLDAHSAPAQAYANHLRGRQKDTLSKAGVDNSKLLYQYDTTFNGIAVNLTDLQAAKLKANDDVLAVWKNSIITIQTAPTDAFLGLTGKQGVWSKQFGSDTEAGRGVIIADIDSGFWPESPSFAPIKQAKADDKAIAKKWKGSCDPGKDNGSYAPVTCNNKVLGARFYDSAGLSGNNPGEFKSPRDFDGHGSHTASTAAGDAVSNVSINGTNAGDVEGVAPGARLAVYKVLYESEDGTTASGSGADIVSAIEDAVKDGADVINYSIGDNVDGFGAEELAFLGAAAAGVFVSAAAGNAGPGASTVDNAMPFETTVAAGTYDVAYTKTVTLGNGATYTGVGVGAAVPSSPLVDSVNVGLAGADPVQVRRCYTGTLDPAKVTGKIVLCERGGNARVDKSNAVKVAGGVGMIQWNPSANSLNADYHFVPSIHVDTATGTAIKAYIAGTANPTASLSAATKVTVEAPAVASFSSRGPSPSSGGGLLKPDVMAPGNDVVAAVSPANHAGNLYDTESGTSMATPHISGVAALLISKHPNWSPMAVRSAMMTTATTVDNAGKPIQGNSGDATPFEMGSGEVNPAAAFNPGLVYDSGTTEWLQYLCGLGLDLGVLEDPSLPGCKTTGAVTPSNYNSPNLAVGALTGTTTLTRTVTNVESTPGNYTAQVSAPAGIDVQVTPSHLSLRPGQSATFTVKLTRTTATLNAYAFGSLTWVGTSGKTKAKVKSVIAVKPVPLSAPSSFTGAGASGSHSVTVTTGYDGTLTAAAIGLTAATVHDLSLVTDTGKFDQDHPATGPGTGSFEVVVPMGTALARFQTLASDYAAGTDIDMYVYSKATDGTLTEVALSAGGTAGESVTFSTPGDYVVFIDVFANPAGPTATLPVKGYSYVVPGTAAGNLTATPASQAVTLAGTASVTVAWSGLTAGQHYLGMVVYGNGSATIGRTIVQVDA
jgi:subtilisin family serine protease